MGVLSPGEWHRRSAGSTGKLTVPLYLYGVRYLRSLAWGVSMAGLLLVLLPLLR
jgi:hypothetical protein